MSNSFTSRIAHFVETELGSAKRARKETRYSDEFAHLEAAHVLGQESTRWHVHVHIEMAKWAWRQKDWKELMGQVVRIVGAATKTFVGLVPRGNTGGTNISPFKKLPLSEEHESIISRAKKQS